MERFYGAETTHDEGAVQLSETEEYTLLKAEQERLIATIRYTTDAIDVIYRRNVPSPTL